MKRDDRNAVIALIVLLILVQRTSTGGLDFKFDTGLTSEDVKSGLKAGAVGVTTYAAIRMAVKGGSRIGRLIPGPVGALIAAASVALFVYPWVKRKFFGGATAPTQTGGTDPLPCGMVEAQICGPGVGVQMWGMNTMESKRYLTVVCKNGSVNTVGPLPEGCK